MLSRTFVLAFFSVLQALAAPTSGDSKPTVKLDDATFVGVAGLGVSKWLGIPFAEPP